MGNKWPTRLGWLRDVALELLDKWIEAEESVIIRSSTTINEDISIMEREAEQFRQRIHKIMNPNTTQNPPPMEDPL